MRQIAAAVGVQAGALYNYVPDKQTLLYRMMMGHMESLLSAYDEPLGLDPMARLDYFVRFHIDQNRERSAHVFIAYMELRNLSPENYAELAGLRRAYEVRLESILSAGKATGVFDIAHVKITARALIAMLNGVNTWYRDTGPLSLDEVSALYRGMVRKMVTAE